ncbi:MAG: hypothetical protein KDE50_24320 [Caldilineaceae bacterium]|nr:hypothetical protein [Caldilineaceae bacterium]
MMLERCRSFYRKHELFCLIFLLFVSFRLLAILLFRPGGFVADASDYDFYMAWGEMTPQGKHVYDNMWTAYPPLFPALMLPVFELASRIPPWVEPRLFFHTFFGMLLLLFESGNLILIYRLAAKLIERPNIGSLESGIRKTAVNSTPSGESARPLIQVPSGFASLSSVLPVILYALLFTPVYTLLGWFEATPLFFMLLGLDLLLSRRRGSWLLSAVATALGFLTKLTPALLAPIAVRWLGARLSWRALRTEWFHSQSRGNLLRPTLYVLLFGAVIVGVGYPLVAANPALALSSFRIQGIRPPWQTIWALLDGYYEAGIVPLRMDNLVGLATPLWQSSLPWNAILLLFGLLYVWLYTRPYDWSHPRTPVAFAATSVIWLFLYSKGWSPQFLVWILVFIVLLLPTLRGLMVSVLLMVLNFVESSIFLIMLPSEHWLLWSTVLARTVLLVLLLVEFVAQIWPVVRQKFILQRVTAVAMWAVTLLTVAGGLVAAPVAADAYQARRWAETPCRDAMAFLQEQASWPNRLIVTAQPEVWREFYPWLHSQYDMRIVEAYSPIDEAPEVVMSRLLNELGQAGEFWWVENRQAASNQVAYSAPYFAQPNVQILASQTLGNCIVQRVVQINGEAAATVQSEPIRLQAIKTGAAQAAVPTAAEAGADLHLVLYWQADAPVRGSYTVFTQLFDRDGALIAQQDNLPVEGLAPTNTWQPGVLIRDAYRLVLPANSPAGTYQLHIGLYDDAGRLQLTLADGVSADHVVVAVEVN